MLAAAVALASALALSGCSTIGTLWAAYGPAPTATAIATPPPGTNPTGRVALAVGDCVKRAALEDNNDATNPLVDCAKPHDLEVFAQETIPDGEYPSVDALTAMGQTTCRAAYGTFVGLDFGLSHLDYLYYYPTESSWAHSDRGLDCAVFDPTGPVTGTLKGAAR